METISIISAIISIVTLIVFFVMARNIYELLREVHKTNEILIKFASNRDTMKIIECPKCKRKFNVWKDEKQVRCSHCEWAFEIIDSSNS